MIRTIINIIGCKKLGNVWLTIGSVKVIISGLNELLTINPVKHSFQSKMTATMIYQSSNVCIYSKKLYSRCTYLYVTKYLIYKVHYYLLIQSLDVEDGENQNGSRKK